jgi:hypothetical protein
LKPGTQLHDLHDTWSAGTSVLDAVLSLRSFNLVAIAGVLMCAVPINGPLLQKSTSVRSKVVSETIRLELPIAKQYPGGYTGISTNRGAEIDLITSNFSTILQVFNRNEPINITTRSNSSNYVCDGSCSTVIQAAGYHITCDKTTLPFALKNGSQSLPSTITFATDFTYSTFWWEDGTTILYSSKHKPDSGCNGNLITQKCTLIPALLEQHILLNNNTISLNSNYTYNDDKLVKLLPNDTTGSSHLPGHDNSTHGGLVKFLTSRFNSSALSYWDGLYQEQMVTVGTSVLEFANITEHVSNSALDGADCPTTRHACHGSRACV